ncbi:DUF262 and DUF1524 domain-containing protein [Clostridium estertheticum]|uniref:DUF262 domain-containing protein n=1 Tax=Clostridium estertheticum TaxID=238834 RepID=A0AA47I9L8_9CLOT|nr:DUF262 and DUF1524 domain-containing protein [Clostridium estertheticum]MBU3157841.1 DUF262 domain-containing protein [Clostridium estertheticum]WAG62589.1 DUF262 domain-containing protein [Clostridium estertheticum]
MDAIKGNINSILNGAKQFIIPVYQRKYSWEQEQCQRLWDDIVEMQQQSRTGHFVGSIVNIAEQAMPTGIQKFMIIDGQQRMTTLTLLLIALRDFGFEHIEDKSINPKEINGMCIQNDYATGEGKYKMLLTQTDRPALIKLIERSPLDGINASRIIDNYKFFVGKIAEQKLSSQQIQEGVAKLQIVNITLDRAVDDAQLIFESLNSTGMDLYQSDLIRNYILMGLEPEMQHNIYENYWSLMEKLFNYEKQTPLMDKFFRDYLTFSNGKIPNFSKVYEEFKHYHRDKYKGNVVEFCKELYTYAKYYTNMYYAKSGDKQLDTIFNDIRQLQMEVAFPFLLKVYADYESNVITKEEFIEMLKCCESYVFRRAIAGIPTNSLNKTFTIMANKINPDKYLNSVKAYMIMLDSYKLFPDNEGFKSDFIIKDVYNMRIRNYIFSKLENINNKAPINIENYTIEHIMPQNKNPLPEWKQELGENWQEVQKTYLHSIGNLTLTAYNSEMSDYPFVKKLEIAGGFKESALRINSYVVKQTTWNESRITERANELCDIAKKIWKYPELTENELIELIPEDKATSEYKLEDYDYLVGDMLELFTIFNKRILNISSNVKREFKKLYIAYKADTNFADIVPQKARLRISINMKFNEVNDPKGLCKDVTDKGRWGNGDIEVHLENVRQLNDVMDIIIQSYNKQID